MSNNKIKISLDAWKKLEEDSQENREVDSAFGDGIEKVPTQRAENAIKLLNNGQVVLTLSEFEKLEQESQEYSENDDVLKNLGLSDERVKSTKALNAERILGNAQITIKLDEMEQLEKESQEVSSDDSRLSSLGLDNEKFKSSKALRAEKILEEAQITITLDEMKKLKEEAEEFEEIESAFGDGKEKSPTKKAMKAKEILSKAKLRITLDEMKKLKEEAEEFEEIESAFGDGKEKRSTKNAMKAKEILSVADLTVTIDELSKLEEDAKEFEEIENIFGKEIMPTKNAEEAREILGKVGGITLTEIGKGCTPKDLDGIGKVDKIMSDVEKGVKTHSREGKSTDEILDDLGI